ncbi:MAG: hypothetical protein ACYSWU_15030 [Planctomycetota bacterium]|jgi:hypothetical protein
MSDALQQLTQEESAMANELLFEKLASRDPIQQKEAADAVNEYTRTKMREDGFFRRIMPPVPISNDELDRQVGTDKPVKVVDKEPDSPAAISLPFATLPMNLYIRGPRYLVMMDRIVTPRFTKDVDELRTWIMDIRQVLSDNAIKDMLAEEDGKFITAVNTALVGAGLAVPTSATVQHEELVGGITRDTLWDMMKIMPNTPSSLEVHTCLINHITIKEVCKFGRTEMGGDLSQDIMKNGWSDQNFMGKRWLITIKKDIVPTNSIYNFSDPKFIGKHYSLEDTTMYIRREAYMLEFFAYETCGATLGHTSGLARADFV